MSFATVEQARGAHALAGKLHRSDVPTLLERGYELIAQTRMRPFRTVAELGVYLRLLRGIRDARLRETVLTDFKPIPGSKLGELAANFDIVLGRTATELEDGTLGISRPQRTGGNRGRGR